MSEEKPARLRELIGALRQSKGINPGISQQADNPDFGYMGQLFEDLLYFGEEHRSWKEVLDNPEVTDCMLGIAENMQASSA